MDIFFIIMMSIFLLFSLGLTMFGLPGNLLILAIGAAYGFGVGFDNIDYRIIWLVAALFLGGEIVEFLAGTFGARKSKAPKRIVFGALGGAIGGGLLGTIIVPIIGSVIGAVGGAFLLSYLVEFKKTNDKVQARIVAKEVIFGHFLGYIFKLIVAVIMIISIMKVVI